MLQDTDQALDKHVSGSLPSGGGHSNRLLGYGTRVAGNHGQKMC